MVLIQGSRHPSELQGDFRGFAKQGCYYTCCGPEWKDRDPLYGAETWGPKVCHLGLKSKHTLLSFMFPSVVWSPRQLFCLLLMLVLAFIRRKQLWQRWAWYSKGGGEAQKEKLKNPCYRASSQSHYELAQIWILIACFNHCIKMGWMKNDNVKIIFISQRQYKKLHVTWHKEKNPSETRDHDKVVRKKEGWHWQPANCGYNLQFTMYCHQHTADIPSSQWSRLCLFL